MKSRLFIYSLLVIFFMVNSLVFSQTNDYLQNNPNWQLHSGCPYPSPTCIQFEDYNYYSNGDTTVNSVIYKKIFRKGIGTVQSFGDPNCISYFYNYIYQFPSFFLRSSAKQMYILTPGNTIENLIYDFNLNVGDSLPLTYNNEDTTVSVTSIDSIYTPYGYRKRFMLTGNTLSQFLIEGIGHSSGLIEPMQVSLGCGFNLTCFSLNDTSYFPVIGPTCNLAVGMVENKTKSIVSISPNPFFSNTEFQIEPSLINGELSFYNSFGQKCKTITHIFGSQIILKRENLSAGLYFYEIKENHEIRSVGKIVISD
ncbi:MAG: T9SS type A sorting domain-containing protein [Bacteroidetes bacterium]|nr:T9SS type A sorting domain-containing protein [Bacteroidota bacterium]